MRSPHSGAGARLGRLQRVLAPLLTLSLIGAGAAACGGTDGEKAESGPITLKVNVFGDFGYKDLYKEFEAANKDVKIVETKADYNVHHKNLSTKIATGAAAGDVETIEVGFINTFTAQPKRFVDLKKYGASELESKYLPWKWEQGVAKDGTVIGLGTDVGSMAIAYRTDMFAEAGLPTQRDEVSKLWASGWDGYFAAGDKFKAAKPDKAWYEASGNVFRAMIGQLDEGLYKTGTDEIIVESNPGVKQAFDATVKSIKAGHSAKLTAWTPEWSAGFAQGQFATIIAPAWMIPQIKTNAPDAAGKWDIAQPPGGGGNVGGSHLAVPTSSKHPEMAAKLVKFLTSPENQLKVFKATGNFPSIPELYDTPDIQNFTNAYLADNAPVGKIYSDAAKVLKPQYLGPKDGDVMNHLGKGLGRVEEGKEDAAAAWASALKDVATVK